MAHTMAHFASYHYLHLHPVAPPLFFFFFGTPAPCVASSSSPEPSPEALPHISPVISQIGLLCSVGASPPPPPPRIQSDDHTPSEGFTRLVSSADSLSLVAFFFSSSSLRPPAREGSYGCSFFLLSLFRLLNRFRLHRSETDRLSTF